MTVISLSVDNGLLHRFDNVLENEGYHNRSEAMRSAIRDFVYRYEITQKTEKNRIEMIIVFTYHDSREIRRKLETIESESEELIQEKLHRHIVEDFCFDMITLRGNKLEINPIIGRIRSVKGIESMYYFEMLLEHEHYNE